MLPAPASPVRGGSSRDAWPATPSRAGSRTGPDTSPPPRPKNYLRRWFSQSFSVLGRGSAESRPMYFGRGLTDAGPYIFGAVRPMPAHPHTFRSWTKFKRRGRRVAFATFAGFHPARSQTQRMGMRFTSRSAWCLFSDWGKDGTSACGWLTPLRMLASTTCLIRDESIYFLAVVVVKYRRPMKGDLSHLMGYETRHRV